MRNFYVVVLSIFKLFIAIRLDQSCQNPKIFWTLSEGIRSRYWWKNKPDQWSTQTANELLQLWVFLLCVQVEILLKNRISFAGSMTKKSWLSSLLCKPKVWCCLQDLCGKKCWDSIHLGVNDENCYWRSNDQDAWKQTIQVMKGRRSFLLFANNAPGFSIVSTTIGKWEVMDVELPFKSF